MKLLFDQNISHRILPNIQDIFPNAMEIIYNEQTFK